MTSHPAVVSRRDVLRLGAAAAALGPGVLRAADKDDAPPDLLIGYTEFRTDLPGGRYVNVATMRAVVSKADGTGRRVLAEDLTREKLTWTQYVGWSPDGKPAIFGRGWKSGATGKWEGGANAKHVKPGQQFNFVRWWSPDGSWVLFGAGEHYDCHPHVVKADGRGLKKLASRNGYRGVIDFLDVYDFHGGSSDLPVWAPDSKAVFYTAKVGRNVELFRVSLDGKPEQLTDTPAGSMHYHPTPSH